MQEDSLCESETYKVSKITLAPNSDYSTNENTDAIHITILEGMCFVNVNGDEFDDAEIGEVIHIHPHESFHVKNKNSLTNCILLKVQIYTQGEKREELQHLQHHENKEETQIDFSTISLRSFRLIGYTDNIQMNENQSERERERENENQNGNQNESEEFKCKYC